MVISFQGQTVIVTGGARGLGEQYARDFAARGANVVIVDSGGAVDGRGGSDAAEDVAARIRRQGGVAIGVVEDVSSEAGAQGVVDRVVERFGTVDILVNNAGIVRDARMTDLTAETFLDVVNVHLNGSFHCSRAVWPIMAASKHGRIVMTTSISGLYGLAGQANYGAAKAGVIGLTHALSIEGADHGILVNAVAPMANTRMNADYEAPQVVREALRPDWVSAAVLFYCARETQVTGRIINCGMGYYAEVRIMEAAGFVVSGGKASPETVRDNLTRIEDMSDARGYGSVGEFLEALAAKFA